MFDQHSVVRILATYLYPSIIVDRRLWRGESKGDYTVKSAYRLCVQELIDTSQFRVNGNWNLDSEHVFFKCPSSQNVWNMAGFLQVVSNATNNKTDIQSIMLGGVCMYFVGHLEATK
jgi:hypothetical protein